MSSGVFAPGKLVLTGAYAVLEGAPSIAIAVSRGATADGSRVEPNPTQEVAAALRLAANADDEVAKALRGARAPFVDASAMFDHDHNHNRKLGLGASAAILVASIAAMTKRAGVDLTRRTIQQLIFEHARNAHREAQGGGSGVDVAASVHGGAIQYVMEASVPVQAVFLPVDLRVHVFASATSARTSELRGVITRLKTERPDVHRACMKNLVAIAEEASSAIAKHDGDAFVESLRRTARGLAALGEAADYPIVPAGFADLESIANAAGASFSVSGAGGGDVAVWVGKAPPTSPFLERARALNLRYLDDITLWHYPHQSLHT